VRADLISPADHLSQNPGPRCGLIVDVSDLIVTVDEERARDIVTLEGIKYEGGVFVRAVVESQSDNSWDIAVFNDPAGSHQIGVFGGCTRRLDPTERCLLKMMRGMIEMVGGRHYCSGKER